jgi:phage baseplate assembly protein W
MARTALTPAQERRILNWGPAIAPIFESALQYGDIVFGPSAGGRDLVLAEGVDNLRQQITSAIVTALGADPMNVGYGFGGYAAIADESHPMMRREKLRFAVLSVLQADPRVKQVLRVLIGSEIEAFRTGTPATADPAAAAGSPDIAGWGTTRIEAQFTIAGGETVRLAVGPVVGGIP